MPKADPVMREGTPTSLMGAQKTPRIVKTMKAKDSVAAIAA